MYYIYIYIYISGAVARLPSGSSICLTPADLVETLAMKPTNFSTDSCFFVRCLPFALLALAHPSPSDA